MTKNYIKGKLLYSLIMHLNFKEKIEEEYGLEIIGVHEAPRQFVAETWFIVTDKNDKYFVKITDKKLFIPEIIESLPTLYELHYKIGLDIISYPIKTKQEKLYVMDGNCLIVLFNKIEANQSYDYDEAALGEALARVHKATSLVTAKIPTEAYEYQYKDQFELQFAETLTGKLVIDEIMEGLQKIFLKYEDRIRMQYEKLNDLIIKMKELDLPKVITHGDAGGNTLVETKEKIYIIDWDGILLAPAERDSWVPTARFLEGYKKIIPDFEPNPTSSAFYTLMYYFRSMAQYMDEIISDKPLNHRKQNLYDIEHELIEGWMVPFLKRFSAY